MNAIEIRDLSKSYGSITALDNLSLSVESNTVHGFLGPNGAGKTTTIKILMGLLRPNGGSVAILGRDALKGDPTVRSKVGYMPELPRFPSHLTGEELLDIYGRMYGLSQQRRREQIPELLEKVGLEARGKDKIGGYSKGMQQRFGIAQALLGDPQLLILDEPSLGLDPGGMVEVREMIRTIAQNDATVFMSSHLLHEAQQVCSRITIINHGRSLVTGTLEEIASQLQEPPTIRVEVESPTDKVTKAVRALSFAKDVSVADSRLDVTVDTQEDVRGEISRAVAKAGGTVLSTEVLGRSLEDTYLKLLRRSGR